MPGRSSTKVVFHFAIHILIGVGLFCAVAGAAILLSNLSAWATEHLHVPATITLASEYLADLLFGLDAICLVFYVCVETWVLIREIWASRNPDEAP